MIEIVVSEEERTQLRQLQLTHPHPVIRRRSLILLLKQQAIPGHRPVISQSFLELVVVLA